MREQTDEKPLRLVLLDDHGLLRASLARLLVSEGGFDVAGEYETSREALEILNSSAVDVYSGPRISDQAIS
jgi:DNA-binding NarL/FixJ family response regulator